jgi:hypothetical protein
VKIEYTEEDFNILRLHNMKQANKNGNASNVFTDEEMASLKDCSAPTKLMSRADKAIKDHKGFMMGAMPRSEAYMAFLPTSEFQRFFSEYSVRMNYFVAVVEVLKDKGIIKNEEITEKLKVLLAPKEIDKAIAKKEQEGDKKPEGEEQKNGA